MQHAGRAGSPGAAPASARPSVMRAMAPGKRSAKRCSTSPSASGRSGAPSHCAGPFVKLATGAGGARRAQGRGGDPAGTARHQRSRQASSRKRRRTQLESDRTRSRKVLVRTSAVRPKASVHHHRGDAAAHQRQHSQAHRLVRQRRQRMARAFEGHQHAVAHDVAGQHQQARPPAAAPGSGDRRAGPERDRAGREVAEPGHLHAGAGRIDDHQPAVDQQAAALARHREARRQQPAAGLGRDHAQRVAGIELQRRQQRQRQHRQARAPAAWPRGAAGRPAGRQPAPARPSRPAASGGSAGRRRAGAQQGGRERAGRRERQPAEPRRGAQRRRQLTRRQQSERRRVPAGPADRRSHRACAGAIQSQVGASAAACSASQAAAGARSRRMPQSNDSGGACRRGIELVMARLRLRP